MKRVTGVAIFVGVMWLGLTTPGKVAAMCQASIKVENQFLSLKFNEVGKFKVTVTNKEINPLRITVIDEIWRDKNCNGKTDASECVELGMRPDDKGGCAHKATNIAAKQWTNVEIAPGEIKEMMWETKNWVANYCYVHHIFTTSLPWDSTNSCFASNVPSTNWNQAISGNLADLQNQAGFKADGVNLPWKQTEYGMDFHIDLQGVNGKDAEGKPLHSIEALRRDITKIKNDTTKSRVIRLALFPWDIMGVALKQSDGSVKFTWKSTVGDIGGILKEIKDMGFKIILTVGVWDDTRAWCLSGNCNLPTFDKESYGTYVEGYYGYLASQWKNEVDVWHLWNESDQWCFSTYVGECLEKKGLIQEPAPNFLSTSTYLEPFKYAVQKASGAIKKETDNKGKIMLTNGPYLNNFSTKIWWERTAYFWDYLATSVDIIGIDFYPWWKNSQGQADMTETQATVDALDYLRVRHGKPVYLLETGILETRGDQCANGYPPEIEGNPAMTSRGWVVSELLSRYHGHADMIGFYTWNDDKRTAECPLYGFRRLDGSIKPSYSVWKNWVDSKGFVATPTPTPTPLLTDCTRCSNWYDFQRLNWKENGCSPNPPTGINVTTVYDESCLPPASARKILQCYRCSKTNEKEFVWWDRLENQSCEADPPAGTSIPRAYKEDCTLAIPSSVCGGVMENCCITTPACDVGLECSGSNKCLKVAPPPVTDTPKVPGDANGDGTVNLTDLGIWKTEFVEQIGKSADFDSDGTVGLMDLGIWKTEYVK